LFHRLLAELGGDGEVELASFGYFTFHPHVALHEADKALGNRQPQTGASILLSTRGDINKNGMESQGQQTHPRSGAIGLCECIEDHGQFVLRDSYSGV